MSVSLRSLTLAFGFVLVVAAPAAAKPPAKTHLGAAAEDLVTLVTETSPTEPGQVAPIAFALSSDGSAPTAFAIPEDAALVVTDVSVTAPRSDAAPGRYVGALCDTPCVFSRVTIIMDTAADGFQKTIGFAGGAVFRTRPQFQTLDTNPGDLAVLVYGYLVKAK
jgi:hypothetical protein